MRDGADMSIKPVTPPEEVATEILRMADSRVVSWRELICQYRGLGISTHRLRRIVLSLLYEGELVELKCRLFTTRSHIERTPEEILAEEIRDVLKRLNLRKCGKPLGNPYSRFAVKIRRNGKVDVYVVCEEGEKTFRV